MTEEMYVIILVTTAINLVLLLFYLRMGLARRTLIKAAKVEVPLPEPVPVTPPAVSAPGPIIGPNFMVVGDGEKRYSASVDGSFTLDEIVRSLHGNVKLHDVSGGCAYKAFRNSKGELVGFFAVVIGFDGACNMQEALLNAKLIHSLG